MSLSCRPGSSIASMIELTRIVMRMNPEKALDALIERRPRRRAQSRGKRNRARLVEENTHVHVRVLIERNEPLECDCACEAV